MPDQDLLPRGHALQPAPQPPAGLADVLVRAGRRRRRQQAGALATGAAACAAIFALTMASGGAVDSLGVTPATQSGRDIPPRETPRVAGPDSPAPAAVNASVGSVDGTTAQSSGPHGAAAQLRQEKASAAAADRQKRSGGEVGPPHTTSAYDPSRGCSGSGPIATDGWCGYYDGARTGKAGTRVELAETLCRMPGRGIGTLLSDDGQQAEFSATDSQDARTQWTWSQGHHFSKQGTAIDVEAGSCVRWHVSWTVVDDAGRPMPRGAYELGAKPHVYPSQATGPARVYADANFITFTVT